MDRYVNTLFLILAKRVHKNRTFEVVVRSHGSSDFVFFAQGLPPLVTLFVTHMASTHRWSGRKYVGLERRLKSRHRNILSLCFNIVNLKNRDVNFVIRIFLDI